MKFFWKAKDKDTSCRRFEFYNGPTILIKVVYFILYFQKRNIARHSFTTGMCVWYCLGVVLLALFAFALSRGPCYRLCGKNAAILLGAHKDPVLTCVLFSPFTSTNYPPGLRGPVIQSHREPKCAVE